MSCGIDTYARRLGVVFFVSPSLSFFDYTFLLLYVANGVLLEPPPLSVTESGFWMIYSQRSGMLCSSYMPEFKQNIDSTEMIVASMLKLQ